PPTAPIAPPMTAPGGPPIAPPTTAPPIAPAPAPTASRPPSWFSGAVSSWVLRRSRSRWSFIVVNLLPSRGPDAARPAVPTWGRRWAQSPRTQSDRFAAVVANPRQQPCGGIRADARTRYQDSHAPP